MNLLLIFNTECRTDYPAILLQLRKAVPAAAILLATNFCITFADEQRSTTVGMAGRIEQIVLPGSELEAKPDEDGDSPIVLRLAATYPHGTAFRYDIVYYGLEPGEFNLADYLRRKDGTSTDDLPPLKVTVSAVLPPGQIEPNAPKLQEPPSLGGYRTVLFLAGAIWIVGLLAILLFRRRRAADAATAAQPLSLADRLRPIVEDAIAGNLTGTQQAELERMLLAFWRERLNLGDMKAADAIVALRENDEAGRLLQQLEIWLHRPGISAETDVAELLRPYRDLPAAALDSPVKT